MPSLAQVASGADDPYLNFIRSYTGTQAIWDNASDRKRQQADALLNNAYKQALMDQMRAAQERQALEAQTEAEKVALAQQAAAEKARSAEEDRIAKERAAAAKREQESVAPIGGSDSTLFGADTQSAIDKAALGMGPGDIAASAEEIARKQRESAQRIANTQSVMEKREKPPAANGAGAKEKSDKDIDEVARARKEFDKAWESASRDMESQVNAQGSRLDPSGAFPAPTVDPAVQWGIVRAYAGGPNAKEEAFRLYLKRLQSQAIPSATAPSVRKWVETPNG